MEWGEILDVEKISVLGESEVCGALKKKVFNNRKI